MCLIRGRSHSGSEGGRLFQLGPVYDFAGAVQESPCAADASVFGRGGAGEGDRGCEGVYDEIIISS